MSDSNPTDTTQQELKDAFQVFNSVASQLATTYQTLEQRIVTLNEQLQAAQNQTLQQLAEKERYADRLFQLLEALPAGVIVIDNRGRVQESNPAASDLLNEPLKGELWRTVIQREFQAGNPFGQEVILRDGRWVSISTCPLGKEPGQIILLIDVTQTRSLQAAVERYKRLSAVGEMSAKVAHQIRTPLASALLYLSNLNQNKASPQDKQRYFEKAMDRLRHLEKVIESMLSFSRDSSANLCEVELTQLLTDLVTAMETELETSNCRLDIRHVDQQQVLFANRDALLSVMQNLVDNAVQACGNNGRIEISTRVAQQNGELPTVDIVVRDNGKGISPDAQKHLFEPFFTTRQDGTGLGLAVALSVVQSHGGGLWMDSTGPNGTTFVMRLPLVRCAGMQRTDNRQAV